MDVPALLLRFERLPSALEALLQGLPASDWRWRPAAGGWSILEVVNHLVDEESADFRTRARLTLENPTQDWPSLDPEAAVVKGRFQERDPVESLARLREERTRSLAWLRTVVDAPWESEHRHPKFGSLRAGDLLASWVAHDARHLMQIARRLHEMAARDGAPFSVAYAG